LFVALRPPISLARRARRREHSNPARRATRRELQGQVEVHTSPTIALAMAASGTDSFVGGAEMLANFSTYYPANASPHGYFKEFLKLSIGLCMRDDAPPTITEDMFTGRAQVSVSAFLKSSWWTFWRPTLPAMMKDLIPCGMGGMGGVERAMDGRCFQPELPRVHERGLDQRQHVDRSLC
jgi:hypothetical protein